MRLFYPIFGQLLILLCSAAPSTAQQWQVQAIELRSSLQQGSVTLPEYPAFISNTRIPALFQTEYISTENKPASVTKEGLNLTFRFTRADQYHSEYFVSLASLFINSDLYQINGTIEDTLSANSNFAHKAQYFMLGAGYDYIHTPDNKFTVFAGSSLRIGIPVAASTSEEILITDEFTYQRNYSFFARKSATAGVSLRFGVRLKLFRNVSATLLIHPSRMFQEIDGSPVATSFRGSNLSFNFKLR